MFQKRIFFAKITSVDQNPQKKLRRNGDNEGQLYFVISDVINEPIIVLFPLHQPAPASTSPGLPYLDAEKALLYGNPGPW